MSWAGSLGKFELVPVPVQIQMTESCFAQAGEVHHLDTAFLLADGAWAASAVGLWLLQEVMDGPS